MSTSAVPPMKMAVLVSAQVKTATCVMAASEATAPAAARLSEVTPVSSRARSTSPAIKIDDANSGTCENLSVLLAAISTRSSMLPPTPRASALTSSKPRARSCPSAWRVWRTTSQPP